MPVKGADLSPLELAAAAGAKAGLQCPERSWTQGIPRIDILHPGCPEKLGNMGTSRLDSSR